MPADPPTPNDPRSPDSPRSGLPTYSQEAVDSLARVYLVDSTGQVCATAQKLQAWIDDHLDAPILARARSGLVATQDPWRRHRLIARRCELMIIEIDPEEAVPPIPDETALPETKPSPEVLVPEVLAPEVLVPKALVRVSHWRVQYPDLKPFFKEHRLTAPEVAVEIVSLKRNRVTRLRGPDLLYGVPYVRAPSLDRVLERWARRHEPLVTEWVAATTRFCLPRWPELKGPGIPWAALEAAWRAWPPRYCPNCNVQVIVTFFGGIAGAEACYPGVCEGVCPSCRRLHQLPFEPGRHEEVAALLEH